jgi:hypothetical protein
VLTELGTWVPNDLIAYGYADRIRLAQLRQRLFENLASPYGTDASNCILEIEQAFKQMSSPGVDTKKLAADFSGGICEAIVYEFFAAASLNPLWRDVRISTDGGNRWSKRNIDFVHVPGGRSSAGFFDAKCTPSSLLETWWRRNWSGHADEWKRDKLYLMLQSEQTLCGGGWTVLLGCVTIRTKECLRKVESKGGAPASLRFFCQEDLAAGFKPTV